DLAGGERLLLVVDGQREEIEAGLRLLLEDDGGEHRGAAVGRQHRAVGLAGDLAGLQNQLAARPIQFLAKHFEHIGHIHLPFLPAVRPRLATTAHRRPCANGTGTGLCTPAPAFPVPTKSRRRPYKRGPDDTTRKRPRRMDGAVNSTTQTQALDQRVVARGVLGLEVIEQTAALADHLEQATTRMVILRVTLEVLGEIADTLAQDRDLDFR